MTTTTAAAHALAAVVQLAQAMTSPAGPPRIEAMRTAMPVLRTASEVLDRDFQEHPSRYPYQHAGLPLAARTALKIGGRMRNSETAARSAGLVAEIAAQMRGTLGDGATTEETAT